MVSMSCRSQQINNKYSQPSVSSGSTSEESTNHGSKIFGKKKYYNVADMYYVVKPTMIASTLNITDFFFFSLFSKQYIKTTIYIALTLY